MLEILPCSASLLTIAAKEYEFVNLTPMNTLEQRRRGDLAGATRLALSEGLT